MIIHVKWNYQYMGTFCVYNCHVFPNCGGKNVWKSSTVVTVIQMVRKTDSNDINTLSLSYYNVNKLCTSIPVN